MPELPDLHVYSINLRKMILNKKIVSVELYNSRKINRPDTFRVTLAETYIKEIARNGKELYFMLERGGSFSVHLMLSGKFFICNQGEAEKINGKMTAICFEDSRALVIADFQGLCRVNLNPKIPSTPDALSAAFTLDYFLCALKKNKTANIKALLIDQKFVRGIGNAYADEILFKADISPESIAGKIPEENARGLFNAIPAVLNDAIENIQKISPDTIAGEERSFLRVHNPRRQRTDEGDAVIVKTVAAKKTYFTARQKLFV